MGDNNGGSQALAVTTPGLRLDQGVRPEKGLHRSWQGKRNRDCYLALEGRSGTISLGKER